MASTLVVERVLNLVSLRVGLLDQRKAAQSECLLVVEMVEMSADLKAVVMADEMDEQWVVQSEETTAMWTVGSTDWWRVALLDHLLVLQQAAPSADWMAELLAGDSELYSVDQTAFRMV